MVLGVFTLLRTLLCVSDYTDQSVNNLINIHRITEPFGNLHIHETFIDKGR